MLEPLEGIHKPGVSEGLASIRPSLYHPIGKEDQTIASSEFKRLRSQAILKRHAEREVDLELYSCNVTVPL